MGNGFHSGVARIGRGGSPVLEGCSTQLLAKGTQWQKPLLSRPLYEPLIHCRGAE